MKNLLTLFEVCAILLNTSCSDKGKTNDADKDIGILVQTTIIREQAMPSVYDYVGTIEEMNSVMLSFEVGGNIKSMMVNSGQKIKRGELLASLEPSELRHAYEASCAVLTQAEDAYNRYGELYRKGSLPEIQWVEIENKYKQAVSAEKIARNKLEDCELYAPFDGVIAEKRADIGMNVLPSQPVFKLVNVQKVKVKIAVPEKEISSIKLGQSIFFTVDALNNRSFECVVTEKGVMADPISHTYEVKGEVSDTDGTLMPGMVCQVALSSHDKESCIIVPIHTIQVKENGENFVWLEDDGTAKICPVETGVLCGDGVIINQGLHNGDKVIVKGYQKISEGMKVFER